MSRLFQGGCLPARSQRNELAQMRGLPYVRRCPRASSNRNLNLAGENLRDAGQSLRAGRLHVNLNRLAHILERRFDGLALRHATREFRHVRHVPPVLRVKEEIYEKAPFFTDPCILARKVEADGRGLGGFSVCGAIVLPFRGPQVAQQSFSGRPAQKLQAPARRVRATPAYSG
jgi:hypothetical protein